MNAVTPFQRSTAVELDPIPFEVEQAIASARVAQQAWSARDVTERLRIIRRARPLIAEEALSLAEAANRIRQRPLHEILSAEVLPLADACRFLERESERILQTRRFGSRGRPLWLFQVSSELRRDPHGIVLIVGPGNYPLFLPAVQTLQALVAGNAILLKPGVGGSCAATAFADLLRRAGAPPNLIQVLPESPTAAQAAIAFGVDKVVFTGSATTGQAVLAQCAQRLTPATVELSGCDAMFVRADADIELVVRAIRFGLRLNNGATCIAPRRVFVNRTLAAELENRLREATWESSDDPPPAIISVCHRRASERGRFDPWQHPGRRAPRLSPIDRHLGEAVDAPGARRYFCAGLVADHSYGRRRSARLCCAMSLLVRRNDL